MIFTENKSLTINHWIKVKETYSANVKVVF